MTLLKTLFVIRIETWRCYIFAKPSRRYLNVITDKIFIVGVNPAELEKIAGGKENTFTARNYNELLTGSFIKKLREKTCEATGESRFRDLF